MKKYFKKEKAPRSLTSQFLNSTLLLENSRGQWRPAVQYHIELDEQALIFITEVVALCRFEIARGQALMMFITQESLAEQYIRLSLEESLRQTARAVLRVPCKDSRFRKKLEEHFSKHSHDGIRSIGWPWVARQLLWESE